ncbi:MAG: hypothetical protein HYY20_04180 [Candidatus Tectomicrobia bacterium]|uniref:Uncharacterized protein n=1 Tax=Tectimicrobiota bacterium TaxID=2528274 RepID=A0A932FW29_UNCTE|nr:hypothetical protein [Candidatus Tectomicrobia bacterium]
MLMMGNVVMVKAENGNPARRGFIVNLESGKNSAVCLLDGQDGTVEIFDNEQLEATGERMMNILAWPKSAMDYRKQLNAKNKCMRS